jgi:hypothetical protein
MQFWAFRHIGGIAEKSFIVYGRGRTCMVNPFSVTSSGRPTVFVDDPAEAIAALH